MDAFDLAERCGRVRRARELVGGARCRRAPARAGAARVDRRQCVALRTGRVHAVAGRSRALVDAVLFFGFAAVAIAGALGVVLARNPVHSALFLVTTMITMAVFFLIQDAPLV